MSYYFTVPNLLMGQLGYADVITVLISDRASAFHSHDAMGTCREFLIGVI